MKRDSLGIHDYQGQLDCYINKIKGDQTLLEENRACLFAYQRSMANKKTPTVVKNMQIVYHIALQLGKPFGSIFFDIGTIPKHLKLFEKLLELGYFFLGIWLFNHLC